MYKIYFKQALAMLKQNKLISIITIVGTALAIMMIMVLIVTRAVSNLNIAPEDKRSRTMYVKQLSQRTKNTSQEGNVRREIFDDYFTKMKTPEMVSFGTAGWDYMVTGDPKIGRLPIKVSTVDANFWRIMSFDFIEGSAFTKEEVESGTNKVVITQSTAMQLYGKGSALGKDIEINFNHHIVGGVIRDVSEAFYVAHSKIYLPINKDRYGTIIILARDRKDFQDIRDQVRDIERKLNIVDPRFDQNKFKGPYSHSEEITRHGYADPDIAKDRRKMVFIFAILLIIPAINLSGFSMSQIKRRTEEIGTRKAFGAKRWVILTQVLYENLITSLIGGVIGLVMSYAVVIWLKEWLLNVSQGSSVPLSAFISWQIFVGVFLACIALNLISASIPAIRASRLSIVDALSSNTK